MPARRKVLPDSKKPLALLTRKEAEVALSKLSRDNNRMLRLLSADIRRFRPRKTRRSSQSTRRAYTRALFAFIETQISWMARSTLTAWHHYLDEEERRLLRNRRLIRTKHGNEIEVRNHRSPANQFFDACDLYCDTWGGRTPINRRSIGWNALIVAQKVRNRITHPVTSSDVTITDSELSTILQADLWVGRMIIEILAEISEISWRNMELLHRHLLDKGGKPPPRTGGPGQFQDTQLALTLASATSKD